MGIITDKNKEQPIPIYTGRSMLSNKGNSLIEVVVSIAILGIILLPILNSFIVAARSNVESKRVQMENMIVQDIMEEMKGKDIESIISKYNEADDDCYEITKQEVGEGYQLYLSNSYTNKDCYYLLKRNIDNKYDALITFDATPYSNGLTGTDYNDYEMPLIRDINSNEHLVAIQSYETEMAVSVLYANHVTYCIGEGKECIPLDLSDIESSIERNIRVVINLSGTNTIATVEFVYSSSVEGCGAVSYELATKELTTSNQGVYVFYESFPRDSIQVINNTGYEIDVFAYEQNTSPAMISISKPSGVNLYSNIPGYEPIKKKDKMNRIFNIKVQLFTSPIYFNPDDVYIPGELRSELQSTKGE